MVSLKISLYLCLVFVDFVNSVLVQLVLMPSAMGIMRTGGLATGRLGNLGEVI